MADLLTLQERFHDLKQLNLCYLGDGNNILHSLLLIAPQLGIHLRYCCPKDYAPDAVILKTANDKASPGSISCFDNPIDAVKQSHAVYTDVWSSMGFEAKDETLFSQFQVNEALMAHAKDNAIFMHCMPMNRGHEVSETLADQACSAIFQQSENRLHIQKALLLTLLSENADGA